MKNRKQTQMEMNNNRRATVLVLVVVLVALLAIMGTTFVITSHINLQAAKNQAGGTANEGNVNGEEIKTSVDSVISQIQTTLYEDLFGTIDPTELAKPDTDDHALKGLRLLGLPCNAQGDTTTVPTFVYNESWDAPTGYTVGGVAAHQQTTFNYHDNTGWPESAAIDVDGDPWLADGSITPNSQITNLFNKYWSAANQTTSWNLSLPNAANITANADGDNDNVVDSVWLVQKGFFQEDANGYAYVINPTTGLPQQMGIPCDLPIKSSNPNLTYRMAVRIVDTCGMVNVNTAWQVPSDLPAAANSEDRLNRFLGNVDAGINLYGCKGETTSTNYLYDGSFGYIGHPLSGKAQDPTLQDLIYFKNYYLMRIENPDWTSLTALKSASPSSTKELANFYPLDISDELDLRYKWASPGLGYKTGSLDPGNRTALETRFTDLYGDTTGTGKLTDYNGDGFFSAADGPLYTQVMADLQKRTNLTAYSFSRNIRTAPFTVPVAETVANFDGRMKNLDRVVYALVYRIKDMAMGGANQFPGVGADADAITASRTENATCVREFIRLVYNSFLGDTTNTHYADGFDVAADPARYANYHTWQYIANLVDYLDDDDMPTDIDTNNNLLQTDLGLQAVNAATSFGNSHVYGLEKHSVISEVVVTCQKYEEAVYKEEAENVTATPAKATYNIQVELYNPWNEENKPGNTETKSPAFVRYFYLTDEDGNKGIHEFSNAALPENFKLLPNKYTQLSLNGTSINLTTTPTGKDAQGKPICSDYHIKFVIVTYADDAGTIPEDIFEITKDVDTPNQSNGNSRSYERDRGTRWSLMVDKPVARVQDDGTTRYFDVNTLGAQNHANAITDCCGYATVTTDASVAKDDTTTVRMADVWCDPSISDLWRDSPTGGGKIARIRNWGDLLVVPYVGYCRNTDGEYKGIGDWLSSHDNLLRFDLTEGTNNQKGYLLREGLLSRYTIFNREDDKNDQLNADNDNNILTNADNIDEMRLPGLININTASANVLKALHPLFMATNRTLGGTKPYQSMSDFCGKAGAISLTNANEDINILGLKTTPDITYDIFQKEGLFTRIANLVTTRSDTFCAYIYVQALDKGGKVVGQRREMVLFDRSLCNQPPLRWNATVTPNCWEQNPDYRPVKIVARQRVD